MDQSLDEQVKIVIRLLSKAKDRTEPLTKESPTYAKALEWVKIAPGKVDGALRQQLIEHFCQAFNVTELEVVSQLAEVELKPQLAHKNGTSSYNDEVLLESILPKGSWFEWYAEYTRYNEAPMSFHVVSSLVALGCAVGRRCWIDQGHFKIFAPVNAILIGPTGVVHKSTAVNIAGELIRLASLCPTGADKITAESLATSLIESPQQFLCASELSVFFGRQKYLEGLSTLILKLLDYPLEMKVKTQARGEERIEAPTLSILGGSTMSLLTDSTPEEVMSSGFLNRFLMVVEEGTTRIFPRPRKGAGEDKIISMLKWLKTFCGEMIIAEGSEADKFYIDWYYSRKKQIQADHSVAEVTQRGPDHLLRFAMLIHLAQCSTKLICLPCLKAAADLLNFYERKAPELVKAIHSSTQNSNTDYVISVLRRLGGGADHSTLLRRVSSRMNAIQFRQVIQTLNESGQLHASTKGIAQYYAIREEEQNVGTGN